MLRIVTDGTADMPNGWQETYDIQVIPINIHFGDKTYLQYTELDNEGFYKMVEDTNKIPKTSQPSPHQFIEFYRKIAKSGETILSLHVTSKLSGTYASSVTAAAELKDEFNIISFDSACGSAGTGMMCREVRLRERAGESIDQIMKTLESIREQLSIALTLDTLKYAKMSGRVGTLQAALASALQIKPIVTLQDGALQMTERVRTRRASMERVVRIIQEKFGQTQLNMAVVHARDPEAASFLMNMVRSSFNIKDLITTDLSIAVAANLGPGTVGIIAYGE
jgi:fatty acid kinase fatty acid binding subunit